MSPKKKINGLDEALNTAQKRTKARNLTNEIVYEKLSEVQDKLDMYLFRKDQMGIRVLITVCTSVASSYNGIPFSTFVILERGKTVWKLIEVYREQGINADAKILNIDKFNEQICSKVSNNLGKIVTSS